jgi:histidine triad (HIT) family protein
LFWKETLISALFFDKIMNKEDCIFCKIVKGEIPSVKIWEDESHIAILDINPNSEGMTLVLTKNHHDSYAFDMPRVEYKNFMAATKKAAKFLEKGLGVRRVAMVMEGLGVNHAHVKLYPIYGLDEKFKEIGAKDKVYFEKYEGYISTQLGPQKTQEELEKVAKKIADNNKKG